MTASAYDGGFWLAAGRPGYGIPAGGYRAGIGAPGYGAPVLKPGPRERNYIVFHDYKFNRDITL